MQYCTYCERKVGADEDHWILRKPNKGTCRKLQLKRNQENFRKNSPEKSYALKRAWIEKNPELVRTYKRENEAKRRAKKAASVTAVSKMEKSMIQALYRMAAILSNTCGESFHVDHIMPLSRGGTHTFENLQILSAHENLTKYNKIQEDPHA
jgi:hypothetical protein